MAVTGVFESFTKGGIVELLMALGARVSAEVTESTKYLIYGAVPGGKKLKKAMENGAILLSERSFFKILGMEMEDNGVACVPTRSSDALNPTLDSPRHHPL